LTQAGEIGTLCANFDKTRESPVPRVAVVLYPNSYLYSIGGLMDAFQIANDHVRRQTGDDDLGLFDCAIVSVSSAPVKVCGGMSITADVALPEAGAFDLIYLPAYSYQGIADLEGLAKDQKPIMDWMTDSWRQGSTICANCTGTLLLAETGLLNGLRATTAWWLERPFRRRFPKIDLDANALLVEDERLMTSGAMTAHLSMAVHLIERYAGPHLAGSCAKTMLIDAGPNSQAPYQELFDTEYSRDPLVAKAQYWLQNHLSETIEQKALANYLNVSQRTLIRRFKQELDTTPLAYLQAVRIEAAKRLLENTGDPLAEIIERVGYLDASSFSRLFRKMTGMTPHAYRQRFNRLRIGV